MFEPPKFYCTYVHTKYRYDSALFFFFTTAGDANYNCRLDSVGKKKARDELNEIESDRACAVQAFRKWVLEQDAWLKSPVGKFHNSASTHLNHLHTANSQYLEL